MNHLMIIGKGGREHALSWKLSLSPLVEKVYVLPGNDGMAKEKKLEMVDLPLDKDNFAGIARFIEQKKIDLVVVGPEDFLSQGLVNFLEEKKILVFGPTREAALLESSKIFAKNIMKEIGIPTADFKVFQRSEQEEAETFIRSWPWPQGMVVKCDGLAQGKGVIVCENAEEGLKALHTLQQYQSSVVIEEKLGGKEVSAFVLCDGEDFIPLGYACDYKRIRDFNRGANTGGMGAYSPVEWLSPNQKEKIGENIVRPLLKAMKERGTPFKGVLFIGLMVQGLDSWVLEFNVRFGDPETQVLLPLLDEDLYPWLLACARGELKKLQNQFQRKNLCWKDKSAVHVVLAAEGYPEGGPGKMRSGDEIEFDEKRFSQSWKEGEGGKLFWAGVKLRPNYKLVTSGGRVAGLTFLGESLVHARDQAYREISFIKFPGAQYRKDIGF